MLTLYVGDTRPALSATIKLKSTGAPLDLTGATAELVYWPVGTTSPVTSREMIVVDAAAGKLSYPWVTDDTATVGTYHYYVKITLPGGNPLSTPVKDKFRVVQPIA